MTSLINILMVFYLVTSILTSKISIFSAILCFIISMFCFYRSFLNLGKCTSPRERQKAMNKIVIDGLSIVVIFIIACLNIAIFNLKMFIVFLL